MEHSFLSVLHIPLPKYTHFPVLNLNIFLCLIGGFHELSDYIMLNIIFDICHGDACKISRKSLMDNCLCASIN